VGTLLHEGYPSGGTVEEAGCPVQHLLDSRTRRSRGFNRLNDFKKYKKQGKKFGVLGCVAQQEGAKIFERAPYVDMVCGSASYRKLPEMLVQLETGQRATGWMTGRRMSASRRSLRRWTNPHRGYITIIEGCDKFCAFCVVPSAVCFASTDSDVRLRFLPRVYGTTQNAQNLSHPSIIVMYPRCGFVRAVNSVSKHSSVCRSSSPVARCPVLQLHQHFRQLPVRRRPAHHIPYGARSKIFAPSAAPRTQHAKLLPLLLVLLEVVQAVKTFCSALSRIEQVLYRTNRLLRPFST